MALGHIRFVPTDETFSPLLREFLRANFPGTLEAIARFWRDHRVMLPDEAIGEADLTAVTFQHVVICIGTVCTYLRLGNDSMTERALSKLDRLAAGFLHSRDPYSYMLAALTEQPAAGLLKHVSGRRLEAFARFPAKLPVPRRFSLRVPRLQTDAHSSGRHRQLALNDYGRMSHSSSAHPPVLARLRLRRLPWCRTCLPTHPSMRKKSLTVTVRTLSCTLFLPAL